MNRRFARKVSVVLVLLMVVMLFPSQAFALAGEVWRQDYEVADFNVPHESFGRVTDPFALKLGEYSVESVSETLDPLSLEGKTTPVAIKIEGVLQTDDEDVQLHINADGNYVLTLEFPEGDVVVDSPLPPLPRMGEEYMFIVEPPEGLDFTDGVPFKLEFNSDERDPAFQLGYYKWVYKGQIDNPAYTPPGPLAVQTVGDGEGIVPSVPEFLDVYGWSDVQAFSISTGAQPEEPNIPELDGSLIDEFVAEMQLRYGYDFYHEMEELEGVARSASHGYNQPWMLLTTVEMIEEVMEYVGNFANHPVALDNSKRGYLNVKHYETVMSTVTDDTTNFVTMENHNYEAPIPTEDEGHRHSVFGIESYEGWKLQSPFPNNIKAVNINSGNQYYLDYSSEYKSDYYPYLIDSSEGTDYLRLGVYKEVNTNFKWNQGKAKGSLYFQTWNADSDDELPDFHNAIVVKGFFVPEKSGFYNLMAVTDDGIYGQVTVDGETHTFADQWLYQAPVVSNKVNALPFEMEAGVAYPIYIEFFENRYNDASFVLTMTYDPDGQDGDPTIENHVIPASYLYPYTDPGQPDPFRDDVDIQYAEIVGKDLVVKGTGPANAWLKLEVFDSGSNEMTLVDVMPNQVLTDADGNWMFTFEDVAPDTLTPAPNYMVKATDFVSPTNMDDKEFDVPDKELIIEEPVDDPSDYYSGQVTVKGKAYYIDTLKVMIDGIEYIASLDVMHNPTPGEENDFEFTFDIDDESDNPLNLAPYYGDAFVEVEELTPDQDESDSVLVRRRDDVVLEVTSQLEMDTFKLLLSAEPGATVQLEAMNNASDITFLDTNEDPLPLDRVTVDNNGEIEFLVVVNATEDRSYTIRGTDLYTLSVTRYGETNVLYDYITPVEIKSPLKYLLENTLYEVTGVGDPVGYLGTSNIKLEIDGSLVDPIGGLGVPTNGNWTFNNLGNMFNSGDPGFIELNATQVKGLYSNDDSVTVEVRKQVKFRDFDSDGDGNVETDSDLVNGAVIPHGSVAITGKGTANSHVLVQMFNNDTGVKFLEVKVATNGNGKWKTTIPDGPEVNIGLKVIDMPKSDPDELFEENFREIEVERKSIVILEPENGDELPDDTSEVSGTVTGITTFKLLVMDEESGEILDTIDVINVDDLLDTWSVDVPFDTYLGHDFKLQAVEFVEEASLGESTTDPGTPPETFDPGEVSNVVSVIRIWKPIVIDPVADFSIGDAGTMTLTGTGEAGETIKLKFTGIKIDGKKNVEVIPVADGLELNRGAWSLDIPYKAKDYSITVVGDYPDFPLGSGDRPDVAIENFEINYIDLLDGDAGAELKLINDDKWRKFLDLKGNGEIDYWVEEIKIFDYDADPDVDPAVKVFDPRPNAQVVSSDKSFNIDDVNITSLPAGQYKVIFDYDRLAHPDLMGIEREAMADFILDRFPVLIKYEEYKGSTETFDFRVKGDHNANMSIEIFFDNGDGQVKIYPETGTHEQVMDEGTYGLHHDFSIPDIPWIRGTYTIKATDLATVNDSLVLFDEADIVKEERDPVVISSPSHLNRVGDSDRVAGTAEPTASFGPDVTITLLYAIDDIWQPLYLVDDTPDDPSDDVLATVVTDENGNWALDEVSFDIEGLTNGTRFFIKAIDDEGNSDQVKVIKSLLTIQKPYDGKVVDYSVFVKGRAQPGNPVTLTLPSGASFITDPANSNGKWTYTLPLGTEADGEVLIQASDPLNPLQGDWVTVNKNTDVVIDSPEDQAVVSRQFTLTGTSRLIGDGEDELLIFVGGFPYPNDGLVRDGVNWSIDITYDLGMNGPLYVKVMDPMTGEGTDYPEKSDVKTYNFIGYVDILVPADGSTVGSNSMTVSGIATPENTVDVLIEGTGTTLSFMEVPVSATGEWSLGAVSISGFSNGGLVITATDYHGVTSILTEAENDVSVLLDQDIHNVTKSVIINNNNDDDDDGGGGGGGNATPTVLTLEEEVTPLGAVEFFEPYVKGFPDGMFRATSGLTRFQTAAIFARVLALDTEKVRMNGYIDLTASDWAFNYVLAATEAGLIEGYPDKTFRGNDYVSRAELADIITNYWAYIGAEVETADAGLLDIAGHWAEMSINQMFNAGVILASDGGAFRPDEDTTREEAVVMINRLIGRPEFEADVSTFPDITKHRSTFGNIEAASRYFQKQEDLAQ